MIRNCVLHDLVSIAVKGLKCVVAPTSVAVTPGQREVGDTEGSWPAMSVFDVEALGQAGDVGGAKASVRWHRRSVSGPSSMVVTSGAPGHEWGDGGRCTRWQPTLMEERQGVGVAEKWRHLCHGG
jgi:hypothetical protein